MGACVDALANRRGSLTWDLGAEGGAALRSADDLALGWRLESGDSLLVSDAAAVT